MHNFIVEQVQVVQLFEHAAVFRADRQFFQIIRMLPLGTVEPNQEIPQHRAWEIRHMFADRRGYEIVSSSFAQWYRFAIVRVKVILIDALPVLVEQIAMPQILDARAGVPAERERAGVAELVHNEGQQMSGLGQCCAVMG